MTALKILVAKWWNEKLDGMMRFDTLDDGKSDPLGDRRLMSAGLNYDKLTKVEKTQVRKEFKKYGVEK